MDEELFDKDYKVVFVNGAKVEFAKNGEWKDVECKYGEVPAAIVPQQIRDYVTKNYPKTRSSPSTATAAITRWSWTTDST